jgi:hypothetical protein
MELSINTTGSDYDLQTADPVTGNIFGKTRKETNAPPDLYKPLLEKTKPGQAPKTEMKNTEHYPAAAGKNEKVRGFETL